MTPSQIAGSVVTIDEYMAKAREGWEIRFWQRVRVTESCWLWHGGVSGKGYGQVREAGRLAHRVAWLSIRGPIPTGMQLDHLCRVRRCVNPEHLEIVTSRENTMRGENHVARNATKTECNQGHPFDGSNTYVWRGTRVCIQCRRRWSRDYRRRRRANQKRELAR